MTRERQLEDWKWKESPIHGLTTRPTSPTSQPPSPVHQLDINFQQGPSGTIIANAAGAPVRNRIRWTAAMELAVLEALEGGDDVEAQ